MSKIPVYFMPGLAASTAILKEYNFQKLMKCIFRMGDSGLMNLGRVCQKN
jgi:hypothetical protein